MLDQPLTARLQSKSIRHSIISSIATDFNLTCSVITIKRDMIHLRKRGIILPS